MTLYESIMLAGVPTSNHESDLYFPMTAETRAILSQYPTEDKNSHVFRNNMDGATWFDVPFAYTPWWEARAVDLAARFDIAQAYGATLRAALSEVDRLNRWAENLLEDADDEDEDFESA